MCDRDEVVVVGAGAAGLATAIALARQNVKVMLLESRGSLGGIVVHALIHTIAGLYDAAANEINEGLPVELAERLVRFDASTRKRKIGRVWVLNACPAVYKKVVESWIREERNVQVFLNSRPTQLLAADHQISSVSVSLDGQTKTMRPRALIDCTGEANVVRLLGNDLLYEDGAQALAGLVFRLRNVPREELAFPQNLVVQRKIQSAVDAGALSPEFSRAWLDTGVYDDEVYLKLSLPSDRSVDKRPRISRIQAELTSFLPTLPAFADASIVQVGEKSFRGGSRAKGDYQLTVDDVRNLRKFPDAACRCCWPIEYWDPAKGVVLEYLKGDGCYDIPKRSLKVAGFQNLWVAGKCFSSDYLAQASARVSGCCWAMGEAAGNAALFGGPLN